MKFKTLAILTILPILFFTACDSKSDKNQKTTIINNAEKQFSLNTINNSQINISLNQDKIILKDINNKIVLLNVFTTWCPACKVEISNLVQIQEAYKNDIVVVGILLEEFKTNEEIIELLKSYNVNYTVTNSSEAFDLAKSLGGIKAIPTTFLIDKHGTFFQKYTGLVPNEMLEIDIKKLLEK